MIFIMNIGARREGVIVGARQAEDFLSFQAPCPRLPRPMLA